MPQGFPFRFYGRWPTEWAEGANDGHAFSVTFSRAPTEQELVELAKRFEQRLSAGIARSSAQPWLWSDRLARFLVGERWPSSGQHLAVVAHAMRDLHEIVPLVDVAYHNARNGGGRWDRWSLDQGKPEPAPEGFYVACLVDYARPTDPAMPAPEPNRAFEAAREQTRRASANRKASIKLGKRKPGSVGAAPTTYEDGVPGLRAGWTDAQREAFQIARPGFEKVPGRSSSRRAPGDHPVWTGAGSRPLATVVVADGKRTGLAWLDASNRRCELDLSAEHGPVDINHVTLLGDAATATTAYCATRHAIFRVDLDAATAERVYEPPGREQIMGLDGMEDGNLLVNTQDNLRVLGPELEPLVERSNRGRHAMASDRRHIVSLARVDGHPEVLAYACGKLKKVGMLKARLRPIGGSEAGFYFSVTPVGGVFQLEDPEGLIDAFVSKTEKAAARKSRAGRGSG